MPAALRTSAAIGLVFTVLLAPLAVAPAAHAASHSVSINDGFFSPANLTITVGDTVSWTNVDDSPHTVTADGGAFASGNLDGGATFSWTFISAGTFTYVCSYHDDMVGTITVVAAMAPAAASATTGAAGAAPSTPPTTAATHDAGAHAGTPPNTAIPAPGRLAGWLSPLLIGLGLVTFALGLIPARTVAPLPLRRSSGWRR